jgi:adenylate cyclase class 2
MLEIELKVRVESLDHVRRKLEQLNAKFCGRVHEHDVYYNAPHRDFSKTDEALRVRYADGKAVVTYKGAKIKNLGLKAREELNTAVKSGEIFENILTHLGFVRTAEVNKWRENYRLCGASVALDDVEHLGTFVEIEVLADADAHNVKTGIERLAKELGVEGKPILASYLELLLTTQ